MVNTVKFSQFATAPLTNPDDEVVGLENGVNVQSTRFLSWTTLTRPATPFNGLLGINTDIQQYEFWNAISSTWIQLAGGGTGSGTVTLLTEGTGITLTPNPITTTGSIALTIPVAVTSGGTGLTAPGTTGNVLTSNGTLWISAPPASAPSLSLTNTHIYVGNISNIATDVPLSGDATISNTGVLALSVVNANVGTFGSGTQVGQFTVNAQGRITAASNVSISGGGGSGTVNAGTINQLAYYAGTGTAVSGLATINSGILVTSVAGVPSISTTLPSGLTIPGYQLTITPATLTETNDTNVTLTLGGTPATALLQTVSLTLGWTGVLSGVRGGTGVNNGASTITIGANVAFSGAFPFTGNLTGSTNVTFPTSGTLATTSLLPTPSALTEVNDTNVTLTLGGTPATALLQAVSITAGWTGTLSGTRGGTGVNNGASTITIGGNVSYLGAFTFAGNLTANTSVIFPTSGTLATTAQLPTPSALTEVNDTNVTLTLGGTPATALLQAVSLNLGWIGTLSGIRGGTGINNGSSTITVGGNVAFSGAFPFTGTLTGSTSVTFPTSGTLATTSLLPTPAALTETNDTNITLTLGGTPSTALLQAVSMTLGWTGTLSGTRGGTGINNGASTITIGGNVAFSGAFTFTGSITANTSITFPTSGTLATTAQLPTLPLSLSNGGTGSNLTASAGGIFYSTAGAGAILSGTATAGQILQSGASTAPTWSTATYPGTAGTSGNLIISNGSNFLSTAMSGDATIVAAGTLTLATVNANVGTFGNATNVAQATYDAKGRVTSVTNVPIAGGLGKVNVTGTSATMVSDNIYIANNAGLVTLTIPTTANPGDRLLIVGSGAGGFIIAQPVGVQVHFGIANSTRGVIGTTASTQQYDQFVLTCTIANTDWTLGATQGNPNIN